MAAGMAAPSSAMAGLNEIKIAAMKGAYGLQGWIIRAQAAIMSEPISAIMHSIVIQVSMDDTVDMVETLMKSKHVSSAPVYDGDGAILGIVTATDLVKFDAMGKDPKSVKASEICTYRPVEVTPDTTIPEVAELMLEHKIHHVVVMENEVMQGIVSSLDFVRLYLQQNPRQQVSQQALS